MEILQLLNQNIGRKPDEIVAMINLCGWLPVARLTEEEYHTREEERHVWMEVSRADPAIIRIADRSSRVSALKWPSIKTSRYLIKYREEFDRDPTLPPAEAAQIATYGKNPR